MDTLKFKKLSYIEHDKDGNPITVESNAVLPTQAHIGDAGYDLTATRITQELDDAGKIILVYHTDLAIEIPHGSVGFFMMRSSVATKSLTLCNCVGVIDENFRGELTGKFKITTDALPRVYQPGDRFAQLVIVPYYSQPSEFVDVLSETERGENGYGSTDSNGTDLILNITEDEHNAGESGVRDSEVPEDGSQISE